MPDIFLPFTLPESVVFMVPFCFSVCLTLTPVLQDEHLLHTQDYSNQYISDQSISFCLWKIHKSICVFQISLTQACSSHLQITVPITCSQM